MKIIFKILKHLGQPIFFYVKMPSRGGTMEVLDVSSSVDRVDRPGNEKADYILIGFRVKK